MKKYFFALILIIFSFSINAKNTIQDYQPIFLPIYLANGELKIALRVFKMNTVPSFVIVDPESLETSVIPIKNLDLGKKTQIKKPGYFTRWKLESTRYYQLLNKNTAPPYPLENKGLTQAETIRKGVVLTIDLCPSSKPFETEFFNRLAQLAERANASIPITIAISGLWIIEHEEEFNWLLKMQQEHKFDITWANHSFSHVYYTDQPYSENFLLSKGVNFELEVLETEKYLLEAGETPSIFFRFPGLVSNKKLIQALRSYGLIPLGANAWLAKGHPISSGGIILVHGNGNEPEGIKLLEPELEHLQFVDIKKAI